MDLSLCIIVKNEEAALPVVLNSVKGVVDEMVVLDTGSTDRTPDIAREFGAQVYYFDWCDDFAAARNEALKYARGQWILVLDADEVLVSELVPHLKSAIANEDVLVINLIRQEIGATQSPYSLVSRLFRNHPDIRFSRPYHAMVDDSVTEILKREPHWKIASLPGVAIWHTGYQADAIAAKNKLEKAQAAMERYLAQYPTDAYACSKLGALYVQSGDFLRGIELLKRGLVGAVHESVRQSNNLVLYELHYHLGIAYRQRQQLAKAKEHYQAAAALDVMPQLKLGAYNNWGNVLKEEGNLRGAQSAYETALKIDPYFVAGHYNLGMVFKAMGKFVDAIAAYQKALEINPNYADAYQNLGVVLLKVGNATASLEAFRKAIELHELRNPLEAKRLQQGLQDMGFLI